MEKINLIDGEFNSKDAREILLKVIQDKIKFHEVQVMGKMERKERGVEEHQQRIEQLKKSRSHVLALFETEMPNHAQYRLVANVTIEKIKK